MAPSFLLITVPSASALVTLFIVPTAAPVLLAAPMVPLPPRPGQDYIDLLKTQFYFLQGGKRTLRDPCRVSLPCGLVVVVGTVGQAARGSRYLQRAQGRERKNNEEKLGKKTPEISLRLG